MTLDATFFYQVLKPGRYLGGEWGLPQLTNGDGGRRIAWFYPERYEFAVGDPAWRRAYFQLTQTPGLCVGRAVEYATDVWTALASRGQPPFAIERFSDITQTNAIVFFAPDPLTAAHIPALLRRLDATRRPEIGVVIDGGFCPRFLLGHVDWVMPAPGGWLTRDLVGYLAGTSPFPRSASRAASVRDWQAFVSGRSPNPQLVGTDPASTQRWVPNVEVEDDLVDVDLEYVDDSGILRRRDLDSLVLDALNGLKTTGVDGVRLCGGRWSSSQITVEVLQELQRRHNMKRVRVSFPAITPSEFEQQWESYRPHLLKPVLRLRVNESADPGQLVQIGRRALNTGWHGLTAVLEFASFDALSRLLEPTQQILSGWHAAAQSHADKRPLRLEYEPASIELWSDPAAFPDEENVRRFSGEFRHFKEDMSRYAAVGTFRIDEIMVRNWISASEQDLWPRLAELDLADPNDAEAPPFDWFVWVRQNSGLERPPEGPFLVVPEVCQERTPGPSLSTKSTAVGTLTAPAENLFGRRKHRTGFTRRLVAPPLTRMRVRWGKESSWRLFSHLDTARAIERAIRRAELPATYSEGFHPRLKLSFGPPLAFGLLSDAEYFDLILDEDFQPSDADRLARAFPTGLRLLEAKGIPAGMPALTDTINEAVFTAVLPLPVGDAQARLDDFHARPDVRWTRIGREDRAPVDPRKTLRSVTVEDSAEGPVWTLTVRLATEGNIRPTDWPMMLFGFTPEQMAQIVIHRSALLIRRAGQLYTPFDPV
jgi:radical SAM-linked protein